MVIAAWSGRTACLFACLVRMEREAAYPVPPRVLCKLAANRTFMF